MDESSSTANQMSHPHSKFSAFSLSLAGGATLSGIAFIPRTAPTGGPRPLLVTVHGGLCNAHHFDVDEKRTASLCAEQLGVPVVSINRPCYKETSSFLPLPEDGHFQVETGKWEHERIFPALWQHYAVPNGCSSIVALGHSLAVPGLVVAAAKYAEDPKPAYKLSGLILSGWGAQPIPDSERRPLPQDGPLGLKMMLMLSDPALQLADKEVEQYMAVQTSPMPAGETDGVMDGKWADIEKSFAAKVNVPIMFAVGERDWLWYGTKKQIREYEEYFPNCPRFDGSVLLNAPHAIEWSRQAQGWYARCFGFALEVTVHQAIQDEIASCSA